MHSRHVRRIWRLQWQDIDAAGRTGSGRVRARRATTTIRRRTRKPLWRLAATPSGITEGPGSGACARTVTAA